MSTIEMATASSLGAWLTSEGYRDEGTHGEYAVHWYRKGQVRVTIEDEADISIYVFDARPQYRKADLLSWDARYTSAPLSVVTRAIADAQDSVRAAMLPED